MEAKTHTSEEFAIIERVARIVSSVRGAKSDYTRLAQELEQAVPFDIFGVVLLRHDRQAVRVTVCQREGNSWAAFYHQHPCQESKLAELLEAPALQVQDYPSGLDGSPAESGDALSGYHQLRSTLIVPLMVEDRVLGTLELGSIAPHTYAEPALQRLVSAVADVLATAIESVQLGGNAAIQDRQRQALKDVTSALNAKMDLTAILTRIVAGVSHALNVASCIVLQDQRKKTLRLAAQAGLDQRAAQQIALLDLSIKESCMLSQTVLRRQSFLSQEIAHDERFPESAALFSALGLHSILTYPLAAGATVYGLLFLCSPEPGGFTPLKVEILALFADQATIAIHNGTLLESVHQRQRFQEAIEQLEQRHLHRSERAFSPEEPVVSADDLALLAHVQQETQRTFGISFTSLLSFISEHLLTRSEQDLRAMFSTDQAAFSLDLPERLHRHTLPSSPEPLWPRDTHARTPFAETLSLLSQTAESALTRAGMVGGLGRLLMQLQQSTNSVRDAWFVVDLVGSCSYMNPAAEALCEMNLEQVSARYSKQQHMPTALPAQRTPIGIEQVFAKLLPRMRNREEVHAYLQEFTQGSIYRQELRCIVAADPIEQRPGTLEEANARTLRLESAPTDYHYQLTRYPLYNEQEHLEGNALQVQDITEQVRDEKNRSALLSSVSHDLRTPLTTIKAAVTGLLQTDVAWDEQDRLDMLEDINSETDHLTVLVNALVELSRIQMGALILERAWCDIVEIAYGALAKLSRTLAGHPVRLQPEAHLPLIHVDHAQLERVFYNLIENAAHHSPEHTPIEILLDTIPTGPAMLRVRVIDHGESIPVYEREHIFTSFYSLRSYSNGMSLAICKGIIEAHQGQIWLEPGTEDGSCFIFTLPTHPHAIPHSPGERAGFSVTEDTRGPAQIQRPTAVQQAHLTAYQEGRL